MLRDYFLISSKNLRTRKLRSWLTMIGIFIGIASVVSLIGLGEGLRLAISATFGFLGPDVLSVQASGINFAGPPGTAVVDPLTSDLTEKISRINGVEVAFNRYLQSGTMEFNDRQDVVFVFSVPEGQDRKTFDEVIGLSIASGRSLKDGDSKKIMVGANFEEDDRFGKPLGPGSRVLLNDETFEVVGVMAKKGSFIFDAAIAMNEEIMLDFFENANEDEVNVIAVKVKNVDDVDSVQASIERLLRKERDVKEGEENFEVSSPQGTLEALNSTLFGVQLFVYIIAFISIIVGGIGITNTMYTAVLERTKEIGIMKSIGATNQSIFTLFFIESGLIGFIGGFIGVVLGTLLAKGLAGFGSAALGSDLIQASISLELIIGALMFSFFVGLIAGMIPAIQASRLQPVDALRFAK